MSDDILFGTASEMAAMIRIGAIRPSELLELHLGQIDRINPTINAIIWQDRENARKLAVQLDKEAARGEFRGPLHGVPVTVKEAFDLVGSPSTWGNPDLKNNYPARDAEVVERYRKAGAIILGKTNVPLNLYEWQSFNELYGSTNNPWDLTRTPGGSSGGSAAALACGMSALEAGSDIGSSARNPAHYCGVFGLKPSWGVVPMQGHLPPGWYGDIDIAVTGPMARHARDLDLAFDILAGADRFMHPAWRVDCPADARTRVREFKIAIKLGDEVSPVDDAYLGQLEKFGRKLEAAGAKVSFTTAPEIDSKAHFELYLTLLGAAMAGFYTDEEIARDRERLETTGNLQSWRLLKPRQDGKSLRRAQWMVKDNERLVARRKFEAFFSDWDILIVPICASAAFPHDQAGYRDQRMLTINGREQPEMLQIFWSGYCGVVGLPAVAGPAGFVNGLPVGYQAISGFGRDRTALAFACAVEREIAGFVRPPIHV
ncbi:MAG: amidase [Nitratireductor sp.]